MPARERERERSKSHSWFELLFVLHTQHTQGRSCVVWWGWVLGAWLMADGCAYVYACVQGWLSLPSALLCPGRCRWPWSVWLAHSIAISTFTFSSQPVCLSLVPPACPAVQSRSHPPPPPPTPQPAVTLATLSHPTALVPLVPSQPAFRCIWRGSKVDFLGAFSKEKSTKSEMKLTF